MILLVAASARASECAAALEQATKEPTQVCTTLARALRQLRSRRYSAVVLDQNLVDTDGATADVVLSEADTAIPVFVSFAITGTERLVRDVRAALQRRASERLHAVREAESNLRSQLTEALTGILLSSQLALEVPALPPAAQQRLRSVYELAMAMRTRLEPPQ